MTFESVKGQSARIYKRASQPEFTNQDSWINMIMLCLEINIVFHKLVDLEKNKWLFHFLILLIYQEIWSLNREKLCPSEGGDKSFIYISRDHIINDPRDSVGEIPSP